MSLSIVKNISIMIAVVLICGCFSQNKSKRDSEKPLLKVGYMPLIDHLTLPVAYEINNGKFRNFKLQLIKYTSWGDMENALKKEALDAAIFMAPLGMKLKKEGSKYKCVAQGCENGSAVVMGKWSGIENANDLKGRVSVIAVPHVYSIHHINLYRFLAQNGVKYGQEVKIVSISPTDVLASLMRKETQGFIASEPFCQAAEAKMIGKIIAFSKDIWPSHPGGVLLIKEKLITENKELVQELVDKMVEAGEYIENNNRKAAEYCSSYYGMDPSLVEQVLRYPASRVMFSDLVPDKRIFERINYYMMKMKLFVKEVPVSDFIDDSFVKKAYKKVKR